MKDRLLYLDSTRGIAAFTVFLSHFLGAFISDVDMDVWNSSILHSLSHGKGAVSYFFVLSGFVLSYTYLQDETNFKGLNYVSFILRRILRIYPVFIVVLLISWIVKSYFYSADNLSTLPQATIWIKQMWQHPTSFIEMVKEALLIVRIPQDPELRLVNQDWTLTIELIVSILVPGFIAIAKKSFSWLLIFLAVLLRLHIQHWVVEFALGILVAQNLSVIREKYNQLNFLVKCLLFIFVLLLYTAEFLIPLPELLSIYITKLSVGLILGLVLCSRKLQNILSERAFVSFGHISYCFYLCHLIAILWISPKLFIIFNENNISNRLIVIGSNLIVTVSVSVFLSYILRYLVEKPALKASRSVLKKLKL